MRFRLMPMMLLLAALFFHYRVLAKLTVLMNTIKFPPYAAGGGEEWGLLSLITRQAPAARLHDRSPSCSEIRHAYTTRVAAQIFPFIYTLISWKKYVSLSPVPVILQLCGS
jgi:hypothetical protein